MKTTHYLYMALCLSAISAVSCTKESNGETPVTEFEKCDIQAIAEQTTKTHISDLTAGTVAWNSGDELSVFSENIDSGNNNRFTSSDISGSKASFSGDIDSGTTSFYAVYPYAAGITYSKGIVSNAVIPATQTATDNSFANGVSLSIAKGTKTPGKPDCGTLTFENLCAVLAFTLPSNITFANEIIVSSKSGANMAGSVTIDCANKAVSGASDASVKLSGSFTGGNTYMVAIAPGTYTGGFSFTINTKGGNSYTRGTTKDLTAQSGKMYNLGKLSLEIAKADLSTSVTISHDIASGVLNGSTAKFSITPKSEFASAISKYKVVLNLKNSSSKVCRTLNTEATTFSNTAMEISNGFYYLPKGDYTYEATVTYYVSNDSKLVEHTFTYNGNTTSPQPTNTLGVSVSGYTSYSTYKGTDGQTASASNANNQDGSTVYNVGVSYSGIADRVANQCSDLLAKSFTYDGSAATAGNYTGQSLAAHTIKASISFDGNSKEASKTVHVTGLPYKVSSFVSDGDNYAKDNLEKSWVRKGTNNKVTNNALRCGGTNGQDTTTAWGTNFSFHVPENINVTLSCPNSKIYTYTTLNIPSFSAKIAGTQVFSVKGADDRRTTKTVSPSGNGTITPSNSEIYVASDRWAAGPYVEVYNVQLTYR